MQGGAGSRLLLRALADEIDGTLGADGRDELLRGVGARVARLAPLPPTATLEALAIEINDALEALGWGGAELRFDGAARELRIAHAGLPRIGSAGDPPGTWMVALLEGLYETWLAQQPGAEPGLRARRLPAPATEAVLIRYARA